MTRRKISWRRSTTGWRGLAIHGGDISDFGLTKEFLWCGTIWGSWKSLRGLAGNHDILGNGMDVFLKVYGKRISLSGGNTKFVCMNTNALNSTTRTRCRTSPSCTMNCRTRWILDGFGDARATFSTWSSTITWPVVSCLVAGISGVEFCLRTVTRYYEELFEDGIPYIGCAAMKDKNYLLFTLTPSTSMKWSIIRVGIVTLFMGLVTSVLEMKMIGNDGRNGISVNTTI